MKRFQVVVDAHRKNIEVKATGSLGSDSAVAFDTVLMTLARGCEQHLTLNLTGLRFVASTGLRAMLRAAQVIHGKKMRFMVCGLQPNIEDVLKTTGFDKRFEITSNRDDAMKALSDEGDAQPAA